MRGFIWGPKHPAAARPQCIPPAQCEAHTFRNNNSKPPGHYTANSGGACGDTNCSRPRVTRCVFAFVCWCVALVVAVVCVCLICLSVSVSVAVSVSFYASVSMSIPRSLSFVCIMCMSILVSVSGPIHVTASCVPRYPDPNPFFLFFLFRGTLLSQVREWLQVTLSWHVPTSQTQTESKNHTTQLICVVFHCMFIEDTCQSRTTQLRLHNPFLRSPSYFLCPTLGATIQTSSHEGTCQNHNAAAAAPVISHMPPGSLPPPPPLFCSPTQHCNGHSILDGAHATHFQYSWPPFFYSFLTAQWCSGCTRECGCFTHTRISPPQHYCAHASCNITRTNSHFVFLPLFFWPRIFFWPKSQQCSGCDLLWIPRISTQRTVFIARNVWPTNSTTGRSRCVEGAEYRVA